MYKTVYITIPPGLDKRKVLEMFNLEGILVDDTCSVSSRGRDVVLWIPEDKQPEEKVGPFWGLQMGQ